MAPRAITTIGMPETPGLPSTNATDRATSTSAAPTARSLTRAGFSVWAMLAMFGVRDSERCEASRSLVSRRAALSAPDRAAVRPGDPCHRPEHGDHHRAQDHHRPPRTRLVVGGPGLVENRDRRDVAHLLDPGLLELGREIGRAHV